jgi:hypothetical protein
LISSRRASGRSANRPPHMRFDMAAPAIREKRDLGKVA